jgi:hypothetical protein
MLLSIGILVILYDHGHCYSLICGRLCLPGSTYCMVSIEQALSRQRTGTRLGVARGMFSMTMVLGPLLLGLLRGSKCLD